MPKRLHRWERFYTWQLAGPKMRKAVEEEKAVIPQDIANKWVFTRWAGVFERLAKKEK